MEGDLVERGKLPFVIDPRPGRAALGQNEGHPNEVLVQKELNEGNFERARTLLPDKITSRSEFAAAPQHRSHQARGGAKNDGR